MGEEATATRLLERRRILGMTAAGVLSLLNLPGLAARLPISNRLSPLNRKRPRRPYTRYIVLHTTEGEEQGSLEKIIRRGEAHYCVTYSGKVYRIIDKEKIAKHAGRSMWEGRTTIDNYSIGIEVVGYHNRDIREAQYTSLRELLRQLKSIYNIPDKNVLTHSMVAYGLPNRFHDGNHRGRKRCGMLFARPEVRARLGLKAKPERDVDVESGRLIVGDKELFAMLFARQPVAVAAAASEPAKPTAPAADDAQGFEGFLEIGKDGDSPRTLAGKAWKSKSTIYFFPDGRVRTGEELSRLSSGLKLLENPPKGTRLLLGYVYGGHVKIRRPPSSIAGDKWNYPSTYYRTPDGSIVNGDEVDPKAIPAGTLVLYQR